MHTANVWTVFWVALGTALATGLGALPFVIIRNFSRKWLGIFNAAAAGLMLGASVGLINQGVLVNLGLLTVGTIGGLFLIIFLNNRLKQNHEAHHQLFHSTGGLRGFLIVGVMTIHSFAEGIGIGVAYGGNVALGALIAVAIAIHNIPEGLAISLVMVPRGTSPVKASLWSVFSSLPQPLMAVPAYLFVLIFHPFLPLGLGLAAGAMLWMVFSELVPEALQDTDHNTVGIVVTLALAAMIALQVLIQPF
ncbi:MAG TPA: ZIP family metal transporter [Anaerolineales bacterium]|nr:ZIP family metal transporter [Anaerolineales bacterium]